MSIRVALNHITHYRYDRLVALGPQVLRLRPAPHCRTPILSYSMRVEPADHFINWQQDAFANYQARLVFPEKTREFKVTVDLVAEMAVYNPFDFFLEPSAEEFPFAYEPHVATELAPYLVKREMTPRFRQFVESIDRTPMGTTNFLVELNQRLQREIAYVIRMEPGVQTPEETLDKALGSCRDTGWLLVQTLRQLGLAARFVSGYLIQLTPDQKFARRPERHRSRLHRPARVVRGLSAGRGLDRLRPDLGPARGRRAHSRSRARRSRPAPRRSPAPSTRARSSSSTRCRCSACCETPRVTKPYTEEQCGPRCWRWARKSTSASPSMDVRLTMGGEPTFVAVRDRDAAEWNTDALGPTKRGYAVGLMDKLRARYGAGGFLHIGQGKWYPGEQLPRWAMSLYWRADGEPVWTDPALFADEREPGAYTPEDAHRFITHLADKLALDTKHIQPGYEDTFYYLWRERRLPVNVDPFDSRLDDELERVRLRRVFDAGSIAGDGLRAAAHARARPADAAAEVGQRPVVLPRRPHVPDPRRFADGLPAAARIAAVGEREATIRTSIAHDPFAPPAPLRSAAELRMQYGGGTLRPARRARPARPARVAAAGSRCRCNRRHGRGISAASAAASPPAVARRVCVVDSPHGAVRRGARPGARGRAEGRSGLVRQRQAPAACLHAAAHRTRRLSRPARRRRSDGRRAADEGVHRRLSAAARPAPEDAAGDAGPGRDRSEHPSGVRTGTSSSTTPSSCTRRRIETLSEHREVHDRRPPHRHRRRQPLRARRRDARRQPVPAPARPAREPARRTGTTIRRCRTCSRACSSGRRARRRASTRRATTSSTSSRSRSTNCSGSSTCLGGRDSANCRRGSSTARCATC